MNPTKARRYARFHALCLAAVLLATFPIASLGSESLRARLEHAAALTLESTEGTPHVEARMFAPEVMMKLYRQRDFEPIWTRARTRDLIALIEQAPTHGLKEDDYGLNRLRELADDPTTRLTAHADADLAFTDAFVRYAHDLRFGKLDAQAFEPKSRHGDDNAHTALTALLDSLIDAPDLVTRTERSLSHGFLYENLRGWLAQYRQFAAQGGWSTVAPGPTLRLGDSDARVRIVRQRLIAEGFTIVNAGRLYFDAELEAAVRQFQSRYGLVSDGVVGGRTLTAMNVPASERIDQIRVNLERLRWVTQSWEERFVAVNIAGYAVYYIEGNSVHWSTRAMVGRPYRQTPLFRSALTYLVLNPDWTVPPTILRHDVLPAIRKDPGYLSAQQMEVLDQTGRRVDPTTIDWSLYTDQHPAQRFPYFIRQRPGALNALGRIKFVFPNDHLVFLHDTPAKQLFEASQRVFSSGCIRVERPLELAALLLRDAQWDQHAIEAEIAKGSTRTLLLRAPVPIIILYLTAIAPDADQFNLFVDVYQRDAALLSALKKPIG